MKERSYPYISPTEQPSDAARVRPPTSFSSLPPPADAFLPQLPSATRDKNFVPGYQLTTHIIPAAHPRLSSTDPLRFTETSTPITFEDVPSDKRKLREWAIEKSKKLVQKRMVVFEKLEKGDVQDGLQDEATKRIIDEGGKRMWNMVNRYARVGEDIETRKRMRGCVGLTVILVCGLGFHKEVCPIIHLAIVSTSGRS